MKNLSARYDLERVRRNAINRVKASAGLSAERQFKLIGLLEKETEVATFDQVIEEIKRIDRMHDEQRIEASARPVVSSMVTEPVTHQIDPELRIIKTRELIPSDCG